MEELEFLLAFLFALADGADDGTDVADVVGEGDAAEGLDEDEDEGLVGVGGGQVTKAHGEHDVGAPVVAPDVLDQPVLVLDAQLGPPVGRRQRRHQVQQDRQHVPDHEVRQEHLHQSVVLLPHSRVDVHVLEPLELPQVPPQLRHRHPCRQQGDISLNQQVHREDENTNQINDKSIFQVEAADL